MRSFLFRCFAVVAAISCLVLYGPSVAAQTPASNPLLTTRPSASAGLELYAEHCIRCHGPFGRGDGELLDQLPSPPRNFAAPATVRTLSPADAFEVVTEGRLEKVMPPWRDALSETERWDVVYGAWSFYFTPTRLARAEAAWTASCADCHGEGGNAIQAVPLARADWLADQSGTDLVALTVDAPSHVGMAFESDPDSLWLAIDFVRSLGFETLPYDDLSSGGRIEGRVVNGTAGEDQASFLEEHVVVQAAPLGVELPGEIISTTLSAADTFTLDVVVGPEVLHRVSVLYKGVEFVLDEFPTGAADESTNPVEIVVFEGSGDVEISVAALHAVLAPAPGREMIEVVERWSLSNSSDRARVSSGQDDPTAVLGLLAGATDVQIHDGAPIGSMRKVGDTMYDLRPIPPGGREVVLIYDLPYASTAVDFKRELMLPLDVQTLTVADENARIESGWATKRDNVELMGLDVEQVVGGPFGVGETSEVHVEGLTAPSAVRLPGDAAAGTAPLRIISQRSIAQFGLIGLGLAVLVAVAYPFLEQRRSTASRTNVLVRQRERVLDLLTELERRNAAGEIAPKEFGRRRAELIGWGIAVERRLDALIPDGAESDAERPLGDVR